jgi:pyruvate ferredoxin oxidoreductase gamma subunit
MAALTRIGDEPILERGVIASPDIVVVADATLLEDDQVRPLQGLTAAGSVLLNTFSSAETLRQRYGLSQQVAVLDATNLALTKIGTMAGLSVALGAATCKLVDLSPAAVEYAVREELAILGLDDSYISRSIALAQAACERMTILPATAEGAGLVAVAEPILPPALVAPHYEGGLRGMPSVVAAANTPLRQTGNWRTWRPVIDLAHCSRCWICFVSCPDGAIALDDADYPHIDYDVCKGCLICAEECPTETIHRTREVDA